MQKIKAEIVLWTAGFVLLTLVINAPLLPLFLRVSGLANGEIQLILHTYSSGCDVMSVVNSPHMNFLKRCSWGRQNEDA